MLGLDRLGSSRLSAKPYTRTLLIPLLLFGVALCFRIPALLSERVPFLFCDEGMFFGEVSRLLDTGEWVTTEFRAGGFNIYLVLIVLRLLELLGISLDSDSVLIFGRLLMTVIIGASGAIFAYLASRIICSGVLGPFLAGLTFAISPFLLGIGRFWYPDHYLAALAALAVYLLLKTYKQRTSVAWPLILGIVIGVAASTKYTAVSITFSALLAIFLSCRPSLGPRLVALRIGAVVIGAVSMILLFNFSALDDPDGFWSGFMFNIENYGAVDATFNLYGIEFYLVVLLVLVLPPLFFLPLGLGLHSLGKLDPRLLAILLALPCLLVVYLGSRGLVINRNMSLAVPFLLPLAALGFERALLWLGAHRSARALQTGLIALLLFPSLVLALLSAQRSFASDPRITATSWISRELPKGVVVGTNEFCSGISPAEVAGFRAVRDPRMKRRLDYYVLNSYWPSVLGSYYLKSGSIFLEFDQRYHHFYHFNSLRLLSSRDRNNTLSGLVPQGYFIVRTFTGDGPEILILKRRASK